MTSHRFIRASLKATRDGVPDPLALVEHWADDLENVLARWSDDPEPLDCYDLVAATYRLIRSRQDLVSEADAERELKKAASILKEQGHLVAERAASIPNVEKWGEDVSALEASFHDLIDPIARNLLAEQVLMDLDDAELVAYYVRRRGRLDPELEQSLEEARDRVLDDASLFLPASVFVQAVGMTLRPQLQEEDYDLAATTLKFTAILDAAEQAEAELEFTGAMLWIPGGVKALVEKYWQSVPTPRVVAARPMVARYRQWLREPHKIAAASAPAPQRTTFRWDSPDGQWVAYLTLPALRAGTQPPQALPVAFYTAEGDPAQALSGWPVWLDGVASQINERGVASFRQEELAVAPEAALRLDVGPQRESWTLHDE